MPTNPFAWRRRRDEAAYRQLAQLRQRSAATPGSLVVHVVSIRQRAVNGDKAVVFDEATNVTRQAWFWHARVRPGDVLAVAGGYGFGPHNQQDGVLYVGGPGRAGVYAALSCRVATRALRRQRATGL